jgi:hypothetical protein
VAGAAGAVAAGTADSVMPTYLADTVRTVLPVILAHGLATEAEVDIDTMAERVTKELKETGATFWTPELAAAWARLP